MLHIPLNSCSSWQPQAQSLWLTCLEGDMNTGSGSSVLPWWVWPSVTHKSIFVWFLMTCIAAQLLGLSLLCSCAYAAYSTPTSFPTSAATPVDTVATPTDSTTTIIIVVVIILFISAGGAWVVTAACIRYRVRKSKEQKTERYTAAYHWVVLTFI